MSTSCTHCGQTFDVVDEDLAFYDKVSPVFAGTKYPVLPPAHCPDCRQQRRLAWRNERNIYNRQCDLCKRSIVSSYSPTLPFPVYCNRCFWSDGWDSHSYGVDYNPAIPFLDQWKQLHNRTPQLAIINDDGIESENCEYCYDFSRGKNCYRMVGSWYVHECHYSLNTNRAKNAVDCNTVSIDCELVYESLDSQRLYHCQYLQSCFNCRDCVFGFDLRGCHDCFCCFGLRQKSFCIFNEQYTETEYREKMASVDLGSRQTIDTIRKQFDEWTLQFPRLFANLQNCEDCSGNNLFNCKSVYGWSVFNSEYSKFIDRSDGPKNCYDLINTGDPQWCLDCVTPDNSYNALFSVWPWKSKYILYSDNCHSSEHLLGCISMKRGTYCILNKQYTKGEYEKFAGMIITSMQKDGSYGELLPIRLSPYGYNESAASEYYPLTKEQVIDKEWKWMDALPYTVGKETIAWNAVPDRISDTPDAIANEIFSCSTCKRNFKMIPLELAFYKQMPCPLPRDCPNCRHLKRFKRKAPTRTWQRQCDNCKKDIETTYSPGRPEKIFCDDCYLKTVY